jgi:hypothetical protein
MLVLFFKNFLFRPFDLKQNNLQLDYDHLFKKIVLSLLLPNIICVCGRLLNNWATLIVYSSLICTFRLKCLVMVGMVIGRRQVLIRINK